MRLLLYVLALAWAGPSFAEWRYGGFAGEDPAAVALSVCNSQGGTYISGGTLVPEVSYDFQCMDQYGPHGGPDALYWVVPEVSCEATLNVSISGTLSRTGPPSASNIPDQMVCHQGCGYALSTAVAATGLDGTELWDGTWIGTGAAEGCSTGADPNTAGNTAEGAAADAASSPANAAETTFDDSIQALNGGAQSPLGAWYSLPSWVTALTTRSTTDCKLKVTLDGMPAGLQSAIYNTDICGAQEFADTFGNWFIWFCAVLWCWAIVTTGRTE